jgi:hypothetical protein
MYSVDGRNFFWKSQKMLVEFKLHFASKQDTPMSLPHIEGLSIQDEHGNFVVEFPVDETFSPHNSFEGTFSLDGNMMTRKDLDKRLLIEKKDDAIQDDQGLVLVDCDRRTFVQFHQNLRNQNESAVDQTFVVKFRILRYGGYSFD